LSVDGRSRGLPPASAAWREGDPPGGRLFADVGPVTLELGETLPAVRVAYETWGTLAQDRSNAVLVLHALTGDAHAFGGIGPGQPTPGWWNGLMGPGAPLDTDRWFVVSVNVLGGCGGTTGPSSTAPDGRPYGSRFPRITVRDQVTIERLLLDRLGIARIAAVLGGSMGGMRALEWLVGFPERVASALVLAVGAEATADQIATQAVQVQAIAADPGWLGGDYYGAADGEGPHVGLGIARRIAHLTYRSELELAIRFGREPQADEDPLGSGRFAVESYLDHHADKLARRFDAGSYVTLTNAMSSHDVGRGRGGVEAALSQVDVPVVVAGVDSDRLYPLRLQTELAELLPRASKLRVIESPYGHDAFLIEVDAVADLVRETMSAVTQSG
jgi:homoserine O-acetyltransferase